MNRKGPLCTALYCRLLGRVGRATFWGEVVQVVRGALMAENQLYYGDNLDILPRYLKDETVDLVYPPFKSNQDYNVLFAEKDGSRSAAQIKAFEDTWRWDQAASEAYHEAVEPNMARNISEHICLILRGRHRGRRSYFDLIAPESRPPSHSHLDSLLRGARP
jgi:hypothetical protein